MGEGARTTSRVVLPFLDTSEADTCERQVGQVGHALCVGKQGMDGWMELSGCPPTRGLGA